MKKILSFIMILAILTLTLTGCSSSFSKSASDLVSELESHDYAAENLDENGLYHFCDMFSMETTGVEAVIVTAPGERATENEEMGYFIYLESTELAKEWYEWLEYYMEDEDEKELVKNFTIKRSNKVVFIGCANTWNKFK